MLILFGGGLKDAPVRIPMPKVQEGVRRTGAKLGRESLLSEVQVRQGLEKDERVRAQERRKISVQLGKFRLLRLLVQLVLGVQQVKLY